MNMGQVYGSFRTFDLTTVRLVLNTVQFITSIHPAWTQLRGMSKKVHHGQLVSEYLEKYAFNKSGVARNAKLSKQRLNDLLDLQKIERGHLESLSAAVNYDFIAAIARAEQEGPMSSPMVADPQAVYGDDQASLLKQLMTELGTLRKSVPTLVETNGSLWEKYQAALTRIGELETQVRALSPSKTA